MGDVIQLPPGGDLRCRSRIRLILRERVLVTPMAEGHSQPARLRRTFRVSSPFVVNLQKGLRVRGSLALYKPSGGRHAMLRPQRALLQKVAEKADITCRS